ncbi:MAG: NUDIX hydrolase [Halobacteriales archaeon]
MSNTDWNVKESRTEYGTGWYDGGYDEVEQPDGTTKRYYWAELPDAVTVVAEYEGDVIFVEQYRPTVRETHLELVAGIVEDGEGYEEAAVRELREETGFVADEARVLQEFRVATGVLRHTRAAVYVDVEERGEPSLDDNEFLSVRRVHADNALDVARDAPANDATLEGLLLAREDGYL